MGKTALALAKQQLAGGMPWGSCGWRAGSGSSLFVCRNCKGEYRVEDGLDPCAFCNSCKDEVLDKLANAIIVASTKGRR